MKRRVGYFTVRTNDFCNIRNKYGAVLCSGYIPRYTKGAPLRVYGEIDGDKINVSEVREGTDKESIIIEYLSSGICKGLSENQSVLSYISKFGGTLANAFDICEYCGRNALESFLPNVYRIGKDINMEFSICDRIAKSMGVKFYNNEMVKIYVEKLLAFCTVANGNTYTTLSILISTSKYIEKS